MADIPAATWTEDDASNNTPAPDGAPEGMAPAGINNVIRMIMGAIKRWFDWSIPKTTGGTSTAYTLSYTVAPTALVDGMVHVVRFNATNGASATLNVNSLGAKPLYSYLAGAWAQVRAGGIPADAISRVSYNVAAGAYFLLDISETKAHGEATAWAVITGATGAVTNSFNVASVSRTGTGGYLVTFSVAMSGTTYAASATASGGPGLFAYIASVTAANVGVGVANTLTQDGQDPTTVYVVCYGP